MPDDGLAFDPASIQVTEIREHREYRGLRVKVAARLGNARIPLQIDVGFGDAITPAAIDGAFPTLLDLPAPKIRAYPKETVIAEKFEAIVTLGMTNSRVKDYYDILMLSRRYEFDPGVLSAAIRATFQRRATPLPRAARHALRESAIELRTVSRRLDLLCRVSKGGAPAGSMALNEGSTVISACERLRDRTSAFIKANIQSWEAGHAQAARYLGARGGPVARDPELQGA